MLIVNEIVFYKVIVINIGFIESQIVDERHFETIDKARAYKASVTTDRPDIKAIIVQM